MEDRLWVGRVAVVSVLTYCFVKFQLIGLSVCSRETLQGLPFGTCDKSHYYEPTLNSRLTRCYHKNLLLIADC